MASNHISQFLNATAKMMRNERYRRRAETNTFDTFSGLGSGSKSESSSQKSVSSTASAKSGEAPEDKWKLIDFTAEDEEMRQAYRRLQNERRATEPFLNLQTDRAVQAAPVTKNN